MGYFATNVFTNAFGDFSLLYNGMSLIDTFFFFSSTLLICLVMMNLFIGILSEKLAEVLESRAEPMNEYAELCELIFQLELLIPYEQEEKGDQHIIYCEKENEQTSDWKSRIHA
jgi:hypothetical protein